MALKALLGPIIEVQFEKKKRGGPAPGKAVRKGMKEKKSFFSLEGSEGRGKGESNLDR